MSITAETAKAHANDPAVTCCRFEAGTTIAPSHLEDPAIFPDLVDSGLLAMPDNGLKIGQVIGATLSKTVDALVPLTPDVVSGIVSMESAAPVAVEAAPVATAVAPVAQSDACCCMPVLKLHIGKGENIDIELPLGFAGGYSPVAGAAAVGASVVAGAASAPKAEKVVRSVTRKHFKIDKVVFGSETKIEGTTLTIRNEEACKEAVAKEKLVEKMSIEIITPADYDKYSETYMDIQPIATKEEGELGSGITRVIDGVIIVVTGTDANGVQIGEFGSSEGDANSNIMWGRPGAPDKGEIFIKTQVTIAPGMNMERPGPLAAHHATDMLTQEIREALKLLDDSLCVKKEELVQTRRPGKKKIVIVKEIMGQGAMHDNLILPVEPVGTLGAKPNVDIGNVPVMLSPIEVLDGGIHALTCIGPASKECSRHYWREPLVIEALQDEEVDLCGVIFVGSPQINNEKFYVSKRLGMMIEAMDVDGAIVTTEGFGNNHIDFASHIEQIGSRGISVVGVSFSAMQGALVVGNKYMTSMVDNNKSKQGIENEILANNTLSPEDAIRAMAMLKTVMAGEPVKEAERKWNYNVKLNNVDAIEKATGKKIALEENEQSLPMSKKRQEVYELEVRG